MNTTSNLMLKKLHFLASPGDLSKSRGLGGEIRVPGDKSISNRAIMLAALADGQSHIEGFLQGEDSLNTLRAFRDMGVEIGGPDEGRVTVHGVGMHGLSAPSKALYLGNSGTSMRLLSGLLAAQGFDVELTGDTSLSRRPMRRVTEPLALMGATIDSDVEGRPPLYIHACRSLKSINYQLPMASAQVKSCLLLAGLYADGVTCVTEHGVTRDHTERMLRGFSYPVKTDKASVSLEGGQRLKATDVDVPADISSAAFFIVAATLIPQSDIVLQHVGINPTRTGVISILRLMGADISVQSERESGGETIADIRVRSANLRGITVPKDLVPLAIDEFPIIFVAAALAEGQTVLTGAEELRVKESDRIQAMADGLKQLGVQLETLPDGIVIEGGECFTAGVVDSHDDHRISMAFVVAAQCAEGEVTIRNCENVATSFPGFVELARAVGMNVKSAL